MDVGLLWHDDDKKTTLEQKVQRAVDYYRAKYGALPNECHVHPEALSPDGAPRLVGNVRVKANKTVIKHHFWLGVAESEGGK